MVSHALAPLVVSIVPRSEVDTTLRPAHRIERLARIHPLASLAASDHP